MLNRITTDQRSTMQQQFNKATNNWQQKINKLARKLLVTVAAVAAASLNIGDMNLQEQLDFLLHRYK